MRYGFGVKKVGWSKGKDVAMMDGRTWLMVLLASGMHGWDRVLLDSTRTRPNPTDVLLVCQLLFS